MTQPDTSIVNLEGNSYKDAKEFPASKLVHWPGQPTACCDHHAAGLVKLGDFMGCRPVVTYAPEGSQCQNCINESKNND